MSKRNTQPPHYKNAGTFSAHFNKSCRPVWNRTYSTEKTDLTGRNLPLQRISVAVTLYYNITYPPWLQDLTLFYFQNFSQHIKIFLCILHNWIKIKYICVKICFDVYNVSVSETSGVWSYEKMRKKRQYFIIQFRSACFVYTSAALSYSDNCSSACSYRCNGSEVLSLKGDIFMKIVVVDNPKFWSFFLRRMFKIKKLPQQPAISWM